MAFNKNKALESALKFLNQGKVPQAIGEYQQILRQDPKDQATLMTVGDLFARQGDMPQAIEYFERLAQVYLNDGFNSKAIAIYKKIAKLAPAELAPLERLADLYVQQGVLSEARPLFLQIAEAHLKANRAPKAVEVLHRLLEVEPENPRVQMRLAELYNVMGQKKEAAQTYLAYSQRLFERGEGDEALKLIDRALGVDASSAAALLLKAKILAMGQKNDEAIAILESHPDADAGGEVTNLLVDLELKAGQTDKAADRARKQLATGSAHSALLQRVAESLIEAEHQVQALPLLRELRDPMIEAGEQDKFLKLLTSVTDKLPDNIEALEMLADFSRHTSDPFHLNAALSQLVDAYAAAGDYPRSEELMQEMIERNKGDERLIARFEQLRKRSGRSTEPVAETKAPETVEELISRDRAPAEESSAEAVLSEAAPPAPAGVPEETYDEETQRYIAQALTDVDLFSSYGLTQKATHLLENVLQRAPRHTPTLERLLDLYLGAGNERRTAELASQLEQIHRERKDTVNADRFAELRQRFQKVAGLAPDELAPVSAAATTAAIPEAVIEPSEAPAAVEAASVGEFVVEAAPAQQATTEFEVPLAPVEAEPSLAEASHADIPPSNVPVAAAEPQLIEAGQEVDLSDEWEAMVQEVAEVAPAAEQEAPPTPEPVQAEEERIEIEAAPEEAAIEILDATVEPEVAFEPTIELAPEPTIEATIDPVLEPEASIEPAPEPMIETSIDPLLEPEPALEATTEPTIETSIDPVLEPEPTIEATTEPTIETSIDPVLEPEPTIEATTEPTIEIIEEPAEETPAAEIAAAEAATTNTSEFELELTPEPTVAQSKSSAGTTEDFLNELASEIEGMESPAADQHVPVAAESASANGSAPNATAESLNELSEVFQEFRNELGELGEEDEDLETHYNLGIAYREMGLLDEAIGEFQKVAKAVQKGKPFRYAMNCSTMLALSFMDKGEPKIASLWYQRALEVPGLDPEAIMALRYDLGVSLDMAGETPAALDIFRQVYALNIDYRDVADRIATLQKH